MADEAETPQPAPRPVAADAHAELVEESVETVTVRRAPKIAVFLMAGAALGVLVALILTFAFGVVDETGGETSPFGPISYTKGEIFGFLVLAGIAAGVALGGIVALILDRTVGRRTRRIQVDKESVTSVE